MALLCFKSVAHYNLRLETRDFGVFFYKMARLLWRGLLKC